MLPEVEMLVSLGDDLGVVQPNGVGGSGGYISLSKVKG
jgi:hypothetical protein